MVANTCLLPLSLFLGPLGLLLKIELTVVLLLVVVVVVVVGVFVGVVDLSIGLSLLHALTFTRPDALKVGFLLLLGFML